MQNLNRLLSPDNTNTQKSKYCVRDTKPSEIIKLGDNKWNKLKMRYFHD